MKPEIVFVYGTLRAGGSNHFRMAGCAALGPGTVRGRLYRVDWYPAVFADPDGGEVVGELYAVSHETLAALDAFEGSEYRRVRIAVTPAGGGDPVDAWIWEFLEPLGETKRIANGDWLSAAGVTQPMEPPVRASIHERGGG